MIVSIIRLLVRELWRNTVALVVGSITFILIGLGLVGGTTLLEKTPLTTVQAGIVASVTVCGIVWLYFMKIFVFEPISSTKE
jgi:hypothetical protein